MTKFYILSWFAGKESGERYYMDGRYTKASAFFELREYLHKCYPGEMLIIKCHISCM